MRRFGRCIRQIDNAMLILATRLYVRGLGCCLFAFISACALVSSPLLAATWAAGVQSAAQTSPPRRCIAPTIGPLTLLYSFLTFHSDSYNEHFFDIAYADKQTFFSGNVPTLFIKIRIWYLIHNIYHHVALSEPRIFSEKSRANLLNISGRWRNAFYACFAFYASY